jgi:hypothetical protein
MVTMTHHPATVHAAAATNASRFPLGPPAAANSLSAAKLGE